MTLLADLASFFGVLMAFSNFPQAWHIWRRKSAKDISFVTYLLFSLGSIVWLLYGIELQNGPLIVSYLIGSVSALAVLVAWYRYH